ncbi:MAG: 30S ribosomal protein S9 [Candidatus Nealsonbacteria bacterium]
MPVKKTKITKPRAKAKPRPKQVSESKEKVPAGRYFEGVGRRKTAVARVRLYTQGQKEILVNEKPLEKYFPVLQMKQMALSSLEKMNCLDKFRVVVKARGGGLNAQSEAVRHGVARALTKFNAEFRKRLKKAGFLTRDSRMRERKKFGLKRARRAPQWKKR